MSDSPPEKLRGYNHRAILEFYKTRLDILNPDDYPVLFWLSRLLPGAEFVFELGGSLGLGYYAYRKYLDFSPRLRWIICEVPEAVRAGQEIARERNETQLAFTDQREVAVDPDIYATFGALQYIEEPFAEIIGKLRARPPHLLINRVPFCDGASFITLQNNGCWASPYKVDNKADFIESLEALDYELVDAWEVDRAGGFLIHPGRAVPHYYGMYFRLKAKPSPRKKALGRLK
ncbi:MAG: methyltransferase, TIGR04325 family [Methylacidiphilales bacterium]|nr:methyltransferase, TIGR04325 family [Candidatus Methylacidiphilales bacterium]